MKSLLLHSCKRCIILAQYWKTQILRGTIIIIICMEFNDLIQKLRRTRNWVFLLFLIIYYCKELQTVIKCLRKTSSWLRKLVLKRESNMELYK